MTNVIVTWHKVLKNVDITRHLWPYDLRHAFVTEAIAAGGDISTEDTLMIHANANMILKHYKYIKDRQKEETIAKLPDSAYVPKRKRAGSRAPIDSQCMTGILIN